MKTRFVARLVQACMRRFGFAAARPACVHLVVHEGGRTEGDLIRQGHGPALRVIDGGRADATRSPHSAKLARTG